MPCKLLDIAARQADGVANTQRILRGNMILAQDQTPLNYHNDDWMTTTL